MICMKMLHGVQRIYIKKIHEKKKQFLFSVKELEENR